MELPKALRGLNDEIAQMEASLVQQQKQLSGEQTPAPEQSQQATDQQSQQAVQSPNQMEGAQAQSTPQGGEATPVSMPDERVNSNYRELHSAAEAENRDLRHRLSTLEGKYRVEVAAVSRENQGLKAQLESLQAEVQQLKDQGTGQQKQEGSEDDLTPLSEDEYGDLAPRFNRLTDMFKRQQDMLSQALSQRDAAIAKIEGQVTAVNQQAAQSAHAKFEQVLDAKCPEWREIESSEAFARWLDTPDPQYGYSRRQLAVPHWQNGDADKVANVYNAFKQQFLSTNQPASSNSQPNQMPGSQSSQVRQNPLEMMAEPSRAGGSSVPDGKKVYTVADMDKNYDDYTKGKWRGKDAEWQALERDMSLAVQEGRVTGRPTVGKLTPSDFSYVGR